MILTNIFMREVPPALRAGMRSGTMGLYGSVIRHTATGQIAGFLQETSGFNEVLDLALKSAAPVRTGLDLAGFATLARQNAQIEAAVATVQSLQVADLALGAAGIGVSIAGFALLNRRIGQVERKVEALGDRLDRIARGVEALRLEPIKQDFARLRTAARQFDQGWSLSTPEREWEAAARETDFLTEGFDRRVEEALTHDPNALDAAEPLLEALALALATCVSARLAAGQDAVALLTARNGTALLARHGSRIRLGDSALARMPTDVSPGDAAWQDALNSAVASCRDLVDGIRRREIAADGAVETLIELGRRDIAGSAWLEAARSETESALLFLPASAGG